MSSTGKFGNRLLDGLPADVRNALRPQLHVRRWQLRDSVCEPGQRIAQAIFPTDATISIVAAMADGEAVEIGMVGREGMFPVGLLLGDDAPPQRAVVQAAGASLVIEIAELRRLLKKHPVFERRLLRYVQTMLNMAAQSVACNRLHPLAQRCARWLLMAHDRTRGDEIRYTHDLLALMLGVRRAGVTVAAQSLKANGLIDYRHGTISIRNRKGLETASCECYAVIAADYVRLIGAGS
jgi:CRP-like cAMP-binding protein